MNTDCRVLAPSLGIVPDFRRSNIECQPLDWIQALDAPVAEGPGRAAVISPGAHTHTSIAFRHDIVKASVPVTELHTSNVHKRESFRRSSHLSWLPRGTPTGLDTSSSGLVIRARWTLRSATSEAFRRAESSSVLGSSGIESA
jgi:3-dehydroquinate dehydratase-2